MFYTYLFFSCNPICDCWCAACSSEWCVICWATTELRECIDGQKPQRAELLRVTEEAPLLLYGSDLLFLHFICCISAFCISVFYNFCICVLLYFHFCLRVTEEAPLLLYGSGRPCLESSTSFWSLPSQVPNCRLPTFCQIHSHLLLIYSLNSTILQ